MLGSFLPLLALATCAIGTFQPSSSRSGIVPNTYIIQVDSSALVKRGIALGNTINAVLDQVQQAGVGYEVRQQYANLPTVFQGASITVDAGTTAADLLRVPGVQRVWPVRKFARPIVTKTPDGAGGGVGSGPVSAAILVSGGTTTYANDIFPPHTMTGVNVTHAAGQLGSGMLICAIDSGVDYLNPILGGCFGPGCHIAVGYDLVGDDFNGDNTPTPSSDPYAPCATHGTHVSGIIGALPNQYGFTGVAPLASLGMFRVLGCTGSSTEDVLLQGYMMAMAAGCNVINLSIGGPGGWISGTATEMIVDQGAAQGIFTAVAAGNEQSEGLFYADDPAGSLTGAGVGSVGVADLPAYDATVIGGVNVKIPYLSPAPFNATVGKAYRLYFTSTNTSNPVDACSPLPAGLDLSGYVVVVQRGTCGFVVKYANVVAAGGTLMILYNDAAATTEVYLDPKGTGLDALATMRYVDGVKLLDLYLKNRITIRFPAGKLVAGVTDILSGGLIAPTSNFGPTFDLYGEPTLVAPGGNIISSYPLSLGGVGILSGTSMSSPFIAGAAAVLMSARKSEGLTVAQIKAVLATTGHTLTIANTSDSPNTPVILQGSGTVQVDLALALKTFVSPTQILLNDTTYLNNVQKIEVTNKNSYTMLYTLSSAVAPGQGLYDTTSNILPSVAPPTVAGAQASVKFNVKQIRVTPGATSSITVTVTPPVLSAADAALFPVYSGWVTLTGSAVGASHREVLTVPYFGLSGSMFDLPVFDTTDTIQGPGYAYPFIVANDIQLTFATYAFPTGPLLLARLAMGTPLITIDLVLANISFAGTISTNNNSPTRRLKRHFTSSSSSPSYVSRRSTTTRKLYSDVPIVGNVYTAGDQPRDAMNSAADGYSDQEIQFSATYTTPAGANGTAEIGVHYRLLLRACKITGDTKYEDQFESWLSPSFAFTS